MISIETIINIFFMTVGLFGFVGMINYSNLLNLIDKERRKNEVLSQKLQFLQNNKTDDKYFKSSNKDIRNKSFKEKRKEEIKEELKKKNGFVNIKFLILILVFSTSLFSRTNILIYNYKMTDFKEKSETYDNDLKRLSTLTVVKIEDGILKCSNRNVNEYYNLDTQESLGTEKPRDLSNVIYVRNDKHDVKNKMSLGVPTFKICTSHLTDMVTMFFFSNFNEDITNWDVSNVTNIQGMFRYNSSFNQDISNWDISNVKDISGMFDGRGSFNQDLSLWDTSSVTNSTSFDKDTTSWEESHKPFF